MADIEDYRIKAQEDREVERIEAFKEITPEEAAARQQARIDRWNQTQAQDVVNHPSHYTAYNGLEIIDLTEQMNFNRGNAVKYIARAGLKLKATEIQDLEKAAWYINREIERLKKS